MTAAWIATAEALGRLVDEIGGEPAYALDTEFHRERTYFPRLALVQVAWPGGVALVDPLAVDVAPLATLFDSGGVAVAHAADQDLEVLDRATGAIPGRLFDTQLAAGFLGHSTPSLGTLARRLIGVDLPKGDRLTDWLRRPLEDDQRTYAAADVAHLLALYDVLREELTDRGRLAWAEQECEELRVRARIPQDPDTAWWRIKEARQLRGRARGVAQVVAAWRERRAAEIDRPVRTVLPDLGVVGVAQRPPRTAGDLDEIRGLEGRRPGGAVAESLIAAVRAGLALREEELRLPPTDDVARPVRPAIALVSAWVAQLGRDLNIDTALLGTRADIEALLRGDPDAKLAAGWRAELVGERIRKLVRGEAALAFDGKGHLVLEARSHDPV